MTLGIDASNIRSGGGLQHLVELLKAAYPMDFGFSKVIVWSGSNTLEKIESRDWLVKKFHPLLDNSILHRAFWQRFKLTKELTTEKCDLLFVPGGTYSGNFRPFVTMSQNLLPFEWKEIKRYCFSKDSLRLVLLRISQSKTFKRAIGTIFLTKYARNVVLKQFPLELKKTSVVNHGINQKFFRAPRLQKDISIYSDSNPIKLLYVSFIGEYKHQWNVVKATGLLRKKYPIHLTLIGSPVEKNAVKKLNHSLQDVDPKGHIIQYYDRISYSEIEKKYFEADIFVFASSCETFGQIVTEAMASGLPIASSRLSALPELLEDSAEYFNPENPEEIAISIEKLLVDDKLREKYSKEVYKKANNYSWKRCADETFHFLNSSFIKNKN